MGVRASIIAPSEVYVVTSDDESWWVYELIVTNNDPRSFSLHSVEVFSNQNQNVPLRSFLQPELSRALSAPRVDDGIINPGVQAMVVFAYEASGIASVSSIRHRISFKDPD